VSLEESFRLRKIPIISVVITVDLNMESSTTNLILFVSSSRIFLLVNCERFEIEIINHIFQQDHTSKF
jgi:hypothetical protein